MKAFLSVLFIPLAVIFLSVNVNYTKEFGLVTDASYHDTTMSIVSDYSDRQMVTDKEKAYFHQFGEKKFNEVWTSLLKDELSTLEEENDYTSVVDTFNKFYRFYKEVYPDSQQLSELDSLYQEGAKLFNIISNSESSYGFNLSRYLILLKGATIQIHSKINASNQSIIASYSHPYYGYFYVNILNQPDQSFSGDLILAIPDSIPVTEGSILRTDVGLFDDTENSSETYGIVMDGSIYEDEMRTYENALVSYYIDLPQKILDRFL